MLTKKAFSFSSTHLSLLIWFCFVRSRRACRRLGVFCKLRSFSLDWAADIFWDELFATSDVKTQLGAWFIQRRVSYLALAAKETKSWAVKALRRKKTFLRKVRLIFSFYCRVEIEAFCVRDFTWMRSSRSESFNIDLRILGRKLQLFLLKFVNISYSEIFSFERDQKLYG